MGEKIFLEPNQKQSPDNFFCPKKSGSLYIYIYTLLFWGGPAGPRVAFRIGGESLRQSSRGFKPDDSPGAWLGLVDPRGPPGVFFLKYLFFCG